MKLLSVAANLHISGSSVPKHYVKTYLLETLFTSHKRDIYSKKKTKSYKALNDPSFEETIGIVMNIK